VRNSLAEDKAEDTGDRRYREKTKPYCFKSKKCQEVIELKKILASRSFKVMIVLVTFFLIVALISAGNSFVNNFLTSYLLTPVQRLTTAGTDSAGKALTPPKSREELEEENSRLMEENRRLNDMLVNYYDIRRENEELEKFYNIKRENRDFTVLTATVIGRDANENFYGFTLDRGSSDGVKMNDAVMTENGLVGWVSELAPKSCKVTTILSPDAGIGALDKRTNEGGIITGSALLADNGLTRLINLSAQHTMQKDDMIVTSGYGGVFPKDIKIGKLKEITLDDYTGMPTAVIEPFEDIRNVTAAVIVTDFGSKGEIDEQAVRKPTAEELKKAEEEKQKKAQQQAADKKASSEKQDTSAENSASESSGSDSSAAEGLQHSSAASSQGDNDELSASPSGSSSEELQQDAENFQGDSLQGGENFQGDSLQGGENFQGDSLQGGENFQGDNLQDGENL